MHSNRFRVIGLGELIWDILPTCRQLGGAPTNFAYMSRLLGENAAVASRIGADQLGVEALARLSSLGIDTAWIQEDKTHPTGTVDVTVDDQGEALFRPNTNSAWDYLEWKPDWKELAQSADAVCFGTLGQRAEQSRSTIMQFLEATAPAALRVFDVNLRHSFFSHELLLESLEHASILKLNDAELPALTSMLDIGTSNEHEAAIALIDRFSINLVALTRGREGSTLFTKDAVSNHSGFTVKVADTIGSGDAFTAMLTHMLLRDSGLDEANEMANRMGAWVATHVGATPRPGETPLDEILSRVGLN